MSRLLDVLSEHWPVHNPAESLLTAVGTTAIMLPKVGVVPATFAELLALYHYNPQAANWIAITLWGLTVPAMSARLVLQRKQLKRLFCKPPARGIWLGPMWVDEKDYWTHILVTGMSGSAKSAGALLPAAKQLLDIYADDDPDPASKNPFKKMGMFVLEAEGSFFEYIVYLVHEAGRNAPEDVLLFRPDPRMLLAKFEDEQKRSWYLNAMSHMWRDKETSSDAHQPYVKIRRSGGDYYPPTMFTLKPSSRVYWDEIRQMDIPVTKEMRFVGWRWDGEELVRVSHTPSRSAPEWMKIKGQKVSVAAPKTLRFVEVVHVNNGLKTNLVKPDLPTSEAASRLTILTKLADSGGRSDSQNDFFYKYAEKQMQNLIGLHRYIHEKEGLECTVIDIVRLTTDAALLGTYLTEVETRAGALSAELKEIADETTRRERDERELRPLHDLLNYFNFEWKKHQQGEGKVANSVNSCITNAFGRFLSDPNLRETYCSPRTLDPKCIFNEGKVLCFVPGKDYETLAKPLCVDSKMDVLSTAFARRILGLDMWRPVCILQDECHNYIISHDNIGDNKALSELRKFRTFYMSATQSDAWIALTIGSKAADVYLQGHGVRVWFQGTDPSTNKLASAMCGQRDVESRKVREHATAVGTVLGSEIKTQQEFSMQKKPFIEPDDFGFMKVGEGVVWNRGEDGKENQVQRGEFPLSFCTSETGQEAVGDRMRHYFREVVENTLHKRSQTARLDLLAKEPETSPTAAVPPSAAGDPGTPEPATAPAGEKTTKEGVAEPRSPLSAELPVRGQTPIVVEWISPPETTPAKEAGTDPSGRAGHGGTAVTKAELAKQTEFYRTQTARLNSFLEAMEYEPVLNHRLFIAETRERLAKQALGEHALANQLAVGQAGKVEGSTEAAAAAKPRTPAPDVVADLSQLARAENDRTAAMRSAAELVRSGAAEARPELEETVDMGMIRAAIIGEGF